MLVFEFVSDLLRSYKAETSPVSGQKLKQSEAEDSTRVQTLKKSADCRDIRAASRFVFSHAAGDSCSLCEH